MSLCRQLVCLLFFAGLYGLPVFGQEQEQVPFDGRVIGKVWYSKVNAQRFFGYTEQVRKDLEIDRGGLMMFVSPVSGGSGLRTGLLGAGQKTDELKGVLLYLVTSPKAGFQQISFRYIKDKAAFRQYVLQQNQIHGDRAELKGTGDNYSVTVKYERLRLPISNKGDDDNKPKNSVVFSVRIGGKVGDGPTPLPKMPTERPTEMTTWYRYNDGVIYESRFQKLHDIKLPDSKSLQPSAEQARHDLFADIDLSEIPSPMKELAWATLQTQTSVYLQQFDQENADDYSLRRTFGEGRLEMIKAGIFDLDRVQFRFQAAESDDKPIQAGLKLTARENSPFAKQLASLNRETSRFAGLAAQAAPMVAVSTVRLPQWARDMLAAQVKSVRTDLEISLANDVQALLAITEVLAVLDETIQSARGDAMVRLVGNAQDGFRVHGGLRVSDPQKLANNIEMLLSQQAANNDKVFVEIRTINDQRVVTLRANDLPVPLTTEGYVMPVELHLTTQGSCVWFSIGDETAVDLLVESLKVDRSQQTRIAGTPVNFRINLTDWLGADENNENGFSRIPQLALRRMEQSIARLMPARAMISINGKSPETVTEDPFPSYLTRALTPENGNIRLQVDTNGRNLEAKLELGTGVTRLIVAQYLESQNRMFKSLPINLEMFQGKDGKSVRLKSGGSAIRIGN